jgi:TonB family protein
MMLLLAILAADLSGTWVGSVRGGPMCLALSQSPEGVSGNLAYENDRKYAAISGGKVEGDRVEFEVADVDRGTVRFGFRVEGEKLLGDDGAELKRSASRRNRQFDAGLAVPPTLISKGDPELSKRARKERLSGTVKLEILILTNGDVDRRSVKVLSSAGLRVDEAAIALVVQWKFTPPREDCSFYEKRMTVVVDIRTL